MQAQFLILVCSVVRNYLWICGLRVLRIGVAGCCAASTHFKWMYKGCVTENFYPRPFQQSAFSGVECSGMEGDVLRVGWFLIYFTGDIGEN